MKFFNMIYLKVNDCERDVENSKVLLGNVNCIVDIYL